MGRWYKWSTLAMLSGAFFFHQADRALFGLLTIPIQNELGLTDVEIGWINTALSWTLAGMAFLAGPVGDRFSRKWIITLSLLSWSFMTFMMGFVGTWTICGLVLPAFWVVLFFRSIATGVGESFYTPCYPALIAAFHTKTRAIALSIHQGALYFGLMSSGIITAWALGVLGTWRHVFMAFGGAGFLLGLYFAVALKDAPSDLAPTDRRKEGLFAGFACFFRTPSALLAMAGFIAIVFVNNAYLFWAPKYMAMKFDMSIGAAGSMAMLWHHLFAFGAIMFCGWLTDHFVPRRPRFRLGLQIGALLCGVPCLLMIGRGETVVAVLAMTSAYGLCRGAFEVNTHASLFDVIPPQHRSTAVGIFTVFAFFVGGLSGVLMGALSQHAGVKGFEYGFALMAAAYGLAALLMMISFFKTFAKDRIHEEG